MAEEHLSAADQFQLHDCVSDTGGSVGRTAKTARAARPAACPCAVAFCNGQHENLCAAHQYRYVQPSDLLQHQPAGQAAQAGRM